MRAYFEVKANGLTRYGLGQYAVLNAHMKLPPFSEQLMITEFLDQETARIDALIRKQELLVELLKEKRAALITAAVTGKIDVSAAA